MIATAATAVFWGLFDAHRLRPDLVAAVPGQFGPQFTHAVRLDHMDWMSSYPDRMPLRRRLGFRAEEARELSRAGRVHTYAGFHIAVVPETE